MPEREWRHRPQRNNACVSKYVKDDVTVIFVRPQKGDAMVLACAPWGPWVVSPNVGSATDLEEVRRAYLEFHPPPPPEPVVGPSVYDLLLRRWEP
jgi:hypothetical protein